MLPKLQAHLPFFICTDLNLNALACSSQTAQMNDRPNMLNFVNCNLVDGLNVPNLIDLLIFNPPYVPTDEAASDNLVNTLLRKSISLYFRRIVMPEAQWAGMHLTDFYLKFRPYCPSQTVSFTWLLYIKTVLTSYVYR